MIIPLSDSYVNGFQDNLYTAEALNH
jgi:hypothetical protein